MTSLKKKSVLITGSGGFLGSHLTEFLVKEGVNVKAFVRYNSRNDWGLLNLLDKEIIENIEIISGDLKDIDTINRISKNIDIIFHLGSIISIPYSYLNPREVIETNVIGTLNVLSAAKNNNVEKIVHTSTSEVYGTAQYVPIDENHPLVGQSPYSASKIAADKIAESFYLSYNLPITIVRPFNTYGPRQSARAVIPTIISQALTQKRILMGSLKTTRDYTFVEDTIRGFVMMAESDKSVGEVVNIGSNFEIPIGELAKKIISLINGDNYIKIDPTRIRPEKSEVKRLRCNNEKAKKILQWEPIISLEEGLKETIDYISSHIELYNPKRYSI